MAAGRRAALLVGGIGIVLTIALPLPIAAIGTPLPHVATAVATERRTAH